MPSNTVGIPSFVRPPTNRIIDTKPVSYDGHGRCRKPQKQIVESELDQKMRANFRGAKFHQKHDNHLDWLQSSGQLHNMRCIENSFVHLVALS